jgi:hypothetical protein
VTGFATPSLTFCESLWPSNVSAGVANPDRLCYIDDEQTAQTDAPTPTPIEEDQTMAANNKQGDVKVTMKHPDGQSLLFTASIIQFLTNRKDKRRPFYLGHWLDTLDDGEVGRLVELTERAVLNLTSDQPVAFDGEDDMLGVAVYALSGETRKPPGFPDNPNIVAALCFMVSMEQARRLGWITLKKGAFSMVEPDLAVAEITDKGLREMPEALKRASH